MKALPHDRYSKTSAAISDLTFGSLANISGNLLPAWQGSADGLLTGEALVEISRGSIPDLRRLCLDLYSTFLKPAGTYSAVQFIPVLSQMEPLAPAEEEQFIHNPVTKHVLVNHSLLRVVLIHWKPGTFSDIHGHPAGGCAFKILKGRLREKRYTPDTSQRLLSVSTLHSGGMAYIDDQMAYHAVGNPFGTDAVSLHVYTPGRRK